MELIICDDEPIILSSIKNRVLKEYPDMHVKTYTSPKKLLANKDFASIYLLDVEMKEMSGLELAAQLRQNISKKNPQPIIIFITGYPAHMQKAFDVQAFHYLLKPLDDEKFSEVLSRAVTEVQLQHENATDYIMIKSGSAHTKLALDDIIFIESNNKKMIVHTTDTVLALPAVGTVVVAVSLEVAAGAAPQPARPRQRAAAVRIANFFFIVFSFNPNKSNMKIIFNLQL